MPPESPSLPVVRAVPAHRRASPLGIAVLAWGFASAVSCFGLGWAVLGFGWLSL